MADSSVLNFFLWFTIMSHNILGHISPPLIDDPAVRLFDVWLFAVGRKCSRGKGGEADITHNHTHRYLSDKRVPSAPFPSVRRLFESFTTARIHILITRRNGYHPPTSSSPFTRSLYQLWLEVHGLLRLF